VRAAVVLFTRDLRVRDNPALAHAVRNAQTVVPLFVADPSIRAGANRRRFLAESLADLRSSLRRLGGDLVVRYGDPCAETVRLAREVGAHMVTVSGEVTGYGQRREARLRSACARERLELTVHPGLTVVPPSELRPSSGGAAYRVFTPYWRAWHGYGRRPVAPTPRFVRAQADLDPGPLPEPPGGGSPDPVPGGETAARQRLRAFRRRAGDYVETQDLLAVAGSSHLSPYLRFGCLSPLELVDGSLPDAFVRQLCWRDFFHQLTAAYPRLTHQPLRSVREEWRYDPEALERWQEGRTGVSIVDAGMRQLLAEGWMPNRARMIVASYLTKQIGLDWRDGAAWFAQWLVDGDVPNNYGNWQWVAGTGTDTKPYRRFNPDRQARRFDPDGAYVRRFVPEVS
jgi:deoxyribodipyrimidine photo-lyase